MNNNSNFATFCRKENGNAVIMVLVALVVVAVGALAYLSGQMAEEKRQAPEQSVASNDASQQQIVASNDASQQQIAEDKGEEGIAIKPGDPVVARVGDIDIKRQDVLQFLQSLPPEARQQPIAKLFPAALEQMINAKVVEDKTKNVKMDNDAEVKKLMAEAKKRIVQTVYVQNTINAKITDERLQAAYKVYTQNFPNVEEAKASHILVDDEDLAKSLIVKLDGGADFAELAKENSKDATASNGGDLGYFLKTDVVPEFGDAVFSTEVGSYTAKPVKSQFGFHIIKVEDKRKRPPADLATVKPFLEAQLRQALLQEVVSEWRDGYKIERFDINGEALDKPDDVGSSNEKDAD